MNLDKKVKRLILGVIVISPLFLLIGQVFAAGDFTAFYDWAKKYYENAVMLGTGLGALVIVYGGFKIFLAGGNASKVNQGKTVIFGALFGIFILVGSYAFIYLVNPEIFTKGGNIVDPELGDKTLYGLYMKEGGTDKVLFLKNSAPNLSYYGSSQQVRSYSFEQPPDTAVGGVKKYAAIFFSDADYRGECYYGGEDATEEGSLPFNPGSVYIFNTKGGGGSPVTVYNNDNGECRELEKVGGAFYPETVTVDKYDKPEKLVGKNERWVEASAVKIDSREILVLVLTRNKEVCDESNVDREMSEGEEIPECFHCQLITKTADKENCYLLKYDYVYNPNSLDTMKPGWIKLFQRIPD